MSRDSRDPEAVERMLRSRITRLEREAAEEAGKLSEARAEIERLRRAYGTESFEVEELLAGALGYERSEAGSPNGDNYIIGDHTAVTLAMEAAHELERLRSAIKELCAPGDLNYVMKRDIERVINKGKETP